MPPTEKTQAVRLVDVFLLAPFMVYAAYQIRPELELTRLLLAGAGVATALYNGQNYLAHRRGAGSGA